MTVKTGGLTVVSYQFYNVLKRQSKSMTSCHERMDCLQCVSVTMSCDWQAAALGQTHSYF